MEQIWLFEPTARRMEYLNACCWSMAFLYFPYKCGLVAYDSYHILQSFVICCNCSWLSFVMSLLLML